MKPYLARPILFSGVTQIGEWRMKLYTLRTADSAPVPGAIIDSALPVLEAHLASEREPMVVAGTDWNHLENYKVGFAMVHVGADAVFLLCDYWVGENMLNHSVWVKPLLGDSEWQPISASGTSVCIWELAVQAHERAAWIKHVYNLDASPSFENYLADVLTTTL